MVEEARKKLRAMADPERARVLRGFFKTGRGEYGEGDVFLGVAVPRVRNLIGDCRGLSLAQIKKLLASRVHEERLLAVLLLVDRFQRGDERSKKETFGFYVNHARRINNWDLVDLSAHRIVGAYLKNQWRPLLGKLARSRNLWERRIAIVATLHGIREGRPEPAFGISRLLLKDKHDLIHKAVGWMLRETGKHCSESRLEAFLKNHAKTMPRTALRYAIERFPESKRKAYLAK